MVPPPKFSLSLVLIVIANWHDDCASIGLGVLPQAFQDADLASSRTISDALARLNAGEKQVVVALSYNVHPATISRLIAMSG
jgi:hypothetical protein